MNFKVTYFRKIAEALLREADDEDETPEAGEDSLDTQIDKYFASYEDEAKTSKNEGLNFRMMTRRFLVETGDDDEEDKGDEEETADDEGGTDEPSEGDDEDDEEEEPEEPKKLTTEDIDIKLFASDVVRLIENYDSLLEVRNTILRRAANFIAKSYESDVVDSFNEELLESHGMEIGKSEQEQKDDFEAPKAGAAGPMGGSGV